MSRTKWVVLAVAVLLCIAGIYSSLRTVVRSVPTMAQMSGLPTIIIDAGHGGVDGGAVGVGDEIEKDINLEIALTMRDIFVLNGFDVVMTRETDVSIHDEGITSVKAQKTSDLHNRLKIVQQYPNAVFISVHQNKFGDSSSSGAQVFYSPNNPGSEHLAEILQTTIVRNLQPNNRRLPKAAGKNLFLMTEAKCTAVLLECGFLSNAEEAGLLVDHEYQSRIAFAAFCGVMEYLELNQPIGTTDVVL